MKPKSNRTTQASLIVLVGFCCATLVVTAHAGPKVTDGIVIKFKETAFESGKLKKDIEHKITGKHGIAPDAKLRPMIDPKEAAKLRNSVTNGVYAQGLKRVSIPVKRFYALEGEFADHRTNVVAQLLEDQQLEIETAYPAPEVSNPRGVPNDPGGTLFSSQLYLHDAPRGVGATNAWSLSPGGACGAGTSLIDLEGGWSLTHKSIYGQGPPRLLWGKNADADMTHGNSVLGIICAKDDQPKGIVGIAPHLGSVRVISHSGKSSNIGDAITKAANNLSVGGVLVIEVQIKPYKTAAYQPVEVEDYVYSQILDAVSKGVVVIEAAGNGASSLETVAPVLDRCDTSAASKFRDSGAIMVAGGSITAMNTWERWWQSNYGSRVDCFADAFRATTAKYPDNDAYTETFDGTSSATAIIAGVALSTQGMYNKKFGRFLDGVRLRTMLTNAATATPSVVAPLNCASVGEWIGVMPDLVAIFKNLP